MVAFPPNVEHVVNAAYPVPRQMLADELSRIVHPLYFIYAGMELAFLLWFYYGGVSARFREEIKAWVRAPLLRAALYVLIAFTGLSVLMLPLSYYGSYVLAHSFGLSDETLVRWLRDWAVGTALGAVVVAIIGALLLRTIARWRSWPIIAAIGVAPLLFFGNAIYPLYIAPLFNTFTPLRSTPLTRSILSFAAQQGLGATVVYEYNMSVQTHEANAYVSGLGKTERIAIGDTLLYSLRPDETLYVVAHEIGHYKLGHLWLGTCEAWLGAVVAIALIATLGAQLASRNPNLSTGLSDPAAVPLIATLLIAFQVVTAPVANAMSRSIEHAADVFAAQHTHLGDAGVRAMARLASLDLQPLHPGRLIVWYFATHPAADERILLAARQARHM